MPSDRYDRCKRCDTPLKPHSIGVKKDPQTGLVRHCRWCEDELAATCCVCSNPLTTVQQRQDGRCESCQAKADAK